MALDPAISLGIKPLDSSTMPNPLSMLGAFATIQNQLNQNRLFQQTFAARQIAGQIIATAPDSATALKQLYANLNTAPFAPEIGNSMRQYELTNAQVNTEYQKNASDTVHAFMSYMPSIIADPTNWDKMANAALATSTPGGRPQAAAALDSLKTAIFGGLEGLPPQQATAKAQQRFSGLLLASGVGGDVYDRVAGSQSTRDTGGSIVSGVNAPVYGNALSAGGGGFAPANAVGKSLAPTIVSGTGAEGQPTTMVVGGANAPGLAAVNSELHGTPAPAGSLNNDLAASASPVGQTLLQGPTAARAAELSAVGKSAGDIQTDMVADAKALPGAVKRIDLMSSALQQFQAGGGADARTSLGKALQALKNAGVSGITDKMINDVANSSLPATQIFNAEVKPLVIGELKNAAQGTGRVMRSEVDAFINMMNSTTDPRALTPLLNQARYALQVGYDQSQRWPEFKQGVESGGIKGYDLGDYYGWYNKQLNPKGLPSRTPGGLQLGPVGGAKGAGAGKPTLRYVPGRGLVPVSGGQ